MQEDFLDMTDRMQGQSLNVIAALALANETALENRDRFAYYRRWSDEYAGMRTAGVQVHARCASGRFCRPQNEKTQDLAKKMKHSKVYFVALSLPPGFGVGTVIVHTT